MSNKVKCRKCMEVETGAFVFAVLNIIFMSLGIVVGAAGAVYISILAKMGLFDVAVRSTFPTGNTTDQINILYQDTIDKSTLWALYMSVVMAVACTWCLIEFAFGMVLLVGLCKKNGHLVKCYYIYGMVKIVMGVACIIWSSISSSCLGINFFVMLFIQLIYGAILSMIKITYKKLEKQKFNSFTNPIYPSIISEKF